MTPVWTILTLMLAWMASPGTWQNQPVLVIACSEKSVTDQNSFVTRYGLDEQDVVNLRESFPDIDTIRPSHTRLVTLNNHWTAPTAPDQILVGLQAAPPGHRVWNLIEIRHGRPVDPQEEAEHDSVCVISTDLSIRLFDRPDALDRCIVIQGGPALKVVGTFENQSAAGSASPEILMPLTTCRDPSNPHRPAGGDRNRCFPRQNADRQSHCNRRHAGRRCLAQH